jgi:hypothetical protein
VGQPVVVTIKPTLDPAVSVFETNRWLTGMGSGFFDAPEQAPPKSIARMLLEVDGVEAVHVYGNIITVTRTRMANWDDLGPKIQVALQNFYIFYPENATTKPGEVVDLGTPTDAPEDEEEAS